VRLSGGERQRLALARAILRKPSLLILDEATSNLDSESEKRIQAAVDGLHGTLTTFVITHRLSTLRNADKIYVLEGGRTVEHGSWDELLAMGGQVLTSCVQTRDWRGGQRMQTIVNSCTESSAAPATPSVLLDHLYYTGRRHKMAGAGGARGFPPMDQRPLPVLLAAIAVVVCVRLAKVLSELFDGYSE
jgi:ABC-type glutathione transport system ATPase component